MDNTIAIQKIVTGLKEKDSTTIAATLSGLVNGSLEKGFLTRLREEMGKVGVSPDAFTSLGFAWLQKLSVLHEDQHYDDRNQASCQFGAKAMEEVPELREWPADGYSCDFANMVSRDHRTLQQSITRLFFRWMESQGSIKTQEEQLVASVMGKVPEEYRYFPFI